jgi:hypothetical protein
MDTAWTLIGLLPRRLVNGLTIGAVTLRRARRAALPVGAALRLAAGPAGADAARARKALDDHYIAFTPKAFVAHADRNDVETVALFLEAGMAASAANEKGQTALHAAARQDDGKLLALLLKAGPP